jgi:PadR family transcriptional regulator PadR
MPRNRPPSAQTISLMLTLAEHSTKWRHGYELCQATGLKAGSLYPILIRLADRGWLEAEWEKEIPAGRPPRHLYRLTKIGLNEARAMAKAQARVKRVSRAQLRPRLEGG